MTDQMELFAPAEVFNEFGVMDDDQAEVISGRVNGRGWDIRVVRFPDGFWRAAPDFHAQDWGFCHPLMASSPGHHSRAQAIEEAAGIIWFHVAKNNQSALTRRALAELETLSPSLPTAKEAT